MPEPTLGEIKDFFGYPSLTAFAKDWKEMPVPDREQIKKGLGDGSLTY